MAVRTLIVNPKHPYTLTSPPLGIGYIIEYAKKRSNNLILFHDENFIDNPNSEILKIIKEHSIDFVGISFPSSAILRVVEICNLVRTHFGNSVKIFSGGYHPTSEPELTLRKIPTLDFIIIGEGEQAVSKLNQHWQDLDNVAYIRDNNFTQNPITYFKNIDDIPFPSRNLYDKRYFKPAFGTIAGIYGKVATLMSSRGCPYSCNFCSSKMIQKTVRYHCTDYVLSEIEHILSTLGNIDYLYFLDVMFLASWNRAEELCTSLIRNRMHKRFKWAATVAANVVDDAKIKLMKKAGCFYLSFGFESNSANVLKLINKRATPEDNAIASVLCKRNNIYINSAFLFGIPGENESDLQDTIKFVKTHNIHFTGVNVMKPLPGSPFYYDFVKQGLIRPSLEEWNAISSINVKGKIYNNKINAETYDKYTNLFYSTIKYRSFFNSIAANWTKRLKYFIQS